jgi:hypothetical protein
MVGGNGARILLRVGLRSVGFSQAQGGSGGGEILSISGASYLNSGIKRGFRGAFC